MRLKCVMGLCIATLNIHFPFCIVNKGCLLKRKRNLGPVVPSKVSFTEVPFINISGQLTLPPFPLHDHTIFQFFLDTLKRGLRFWSERIREPNFFLRFLCRKVPEFCQRFFRWDNLGLFHTIFYWFFAFPIILRSSIVLSSFYFLMDKMMTKTIDAQSPVLLTLTLSLIRFIKKSIIS